MKLDELFEDGKNLIKERIGYIFISFQKAFPEVDYDERSSIVGIGEPGKHLLCYFRRGGKDVLENIVICNQETNKEKADSFPNWHANGRRYQARKVKGMSNEYDIYQMD